MTIHTYMISLQYWKKKYIRQLCAKVHIYIHHPGVFCYVRCCALAMLTAFASCNTVIMLTAFPPHASPFTVCNTVCSMIITSHVGRVRINRVRLPILDVVSRTGKMNISLSPFAPGNLVSRDGFGSSLPRQSAHLHTQAESGAYLRDSSRFTRRRPFVYLKSPYAIRSVPSLSGHTISYRWRLLPRVDRPRANSPQGSSKRVLPWQVTMDQLLCASLSHTH